MARLWAAVKRIWESTYNITKEIAAKITKGTGTALGNIGVTIAAIMAIIILAAILALVLMISLPWGLFGGTYYGQSQTVAA